MLQISKRLQPFGYESRILASQWGAHGSPEQEVYSGVSIKRLGISFRISHYFYTPSLTRELESCDPDIIHAHGYRTYQTQAAFRYAKRRKIPFVLSMDGSGFGYNSLITGEMRKVPYLLYDRLGGLRQVSGSDAIIANTATEAGELMIHLGAEEDKIHVIPIGIDGNPPSKGSSNGHNMIFVARLAPQRDPGVLVRALAVVLPEFPDARMTIVGGNVS